MSYEIFRNRVFLTPKFKSTVREHHTLDETLKALAQEDGGIGVLPRLPVENENLKPLFITPSADEVAFGPTPES